MPRKTADKRFTKDHEWVTLDGDIATVGITEHAQEQLGELVFIELPELERQVVAGEACAVVESVKAASDVYAPLAGRVAEVNETIVEDPSIANSDSEGEGWFFRLELDDPASFEELLDQDGYDEFLETL
jgi:glycine cleavage system H protein